jgi:hypothetical protein
VYLEGKRLNPMNKLKLMTAIVENSKIAFNSFKKPWIFKGKFREN